MNNFEISTTMATMSSREIAFLTGKSHKNVLVDCDNLNVNYQKLNMAEISAMEEEHPTIAGRMIRVFQLTRMQTFDLVTGYNTELRIKVNRRWEELENSNGIGNKLVGVLDKLADTIGNMDRRLERLESRVYNPVSPELQERELQPDIIDATNKEYDYVEVNNHKVRRIVLDGRPYFSINDINMGIGAATSAYQAARKLNRGGKQLAIKILIYGNTHPAWFTSKKGLDLIISGSRKLKGRRINYNF